MPLGFGRFTFGVSVYQGGSVSPDAPNYRTPMGKRARSMAETGAGTSGNISYVVRFQAVVPRSLPGRFMHFLGRFFFTLYIEL